MALNKQITDEKGVTSAYHRIAGINQNFINSEPIIEVYVYHYSEAEYREIEKTKIVEDKDFQNIIATDRHTFDLDDAKGVTRSDLYTRMTNELPEYKEATEI